ncbi:MULTISPECIES: phosphohistidine phosphatase SixA [Photobacterium]|uniref:Phosphohistidine phosphatase n=1 Tax=Photobacterium halotolerans TaxID=265726 RepID=A0A0F5VH45_9GAMM|nr:MULTISPECIES: phosphohistidine phosphatase SixA [Photobacterium]KKD01122.1 phosphohistidine phosphatase [Photobacterium halotolerans]UIP28753.1 phosphohistidine phosphatase SixA [Photobacterium sp. TLY01]
MRIFIMRHGEAQHFAPSDAERPLTAQGKMYSRQMAKQLASHLDEQLDLVWVSPYLRAQQTWQAMSEELPVPKTLMTVDDITPYGDASQVADYLKAVIALEKPKTVLLVSHLPLVGYLSAELVPGLQPLMFRTSSIAAVDFHPEGEPSALLWQENPVEAVQPNHH